MRRVCSLVVAVTLTQACARPAAARPDPDGIEAARLWRTAPTGPPAATIRRLTRQEYVNTVADLLGLTLERHAIGLPRDPAVSGFRNDATTLQASDTRVGAYE